MSSQFTGVDHYPQFKYLEDNWKTILAEYTSIKDMTFNWPEPDLYNEGWTILPIRFKGMEIKEIQDACPFTTSAVNTIPNIVNAGFSILQSGTVIYPHTGYTEEVLRVHLGLVCPRGAWIKVGDEKSEWQEGKVFVFDDTILHEAQNNSDTPRVILLLDFIKNHKDLN